MAGIQSNPLLFHGTASLTQEQFDNPVVHTAAITDLIGVKSKVPCVIKLSLAGFECVGAVDPKKRESPRLLGSFPINELVLTKSKSTTMCIVSKGYARAEAGGPEWLRPINTLYVFTAASFEDASTLCAAAVDLRQSWDDHVKTIVLRNFTEAQLINPLIHRIGRRHRRSPEQVLVRWLLTRWLDGCGCLCVPANLDPRYIEALLGITGWHLPPEDVVTLLPLTRDFRYEEMLRRQLGDEVADAVQLSVDWALAAAGKKKSHGTSRSDSPPLVEPLLPAAKQIARLEQLNEVLKKEEEVQVRRRGTGSSMVRPDSHNPYTPPTSAPPVSDSPPASLGAAASPGAAEAGAAGGGRRGLTKRLSTVRLTQFSALYRSMDAAWRGCAEQAPHLEIAVIERLTSTLVAKAEADGQPTVTQADVLTAMRDTVGAAAASTEPYAKAIFEVLDFEETGRIDPADIAFFLYLSAAADVGSKLRAVAGILRPEEGGEKVAISELCALVRIIQTVQPAANPDPAPFDEYGTAQMFRDELGGDEVVEVESVIALSTHSPRIQASLTTPLRSLGGSAGPASSGDWTDIGPKGGAAATLKRLREEAKQRVKADMKAERKEDKARAKSLKKRASKKSK
eukprot:m.450367 g.450367  ORF g.450367 m.450367 type:complete len:624 (-) comp19984_c0_seq1:1746-3617(-)